MEGMARLLVVHHSPTRSTRALLDAALEGARHPDIEGVEVQVVPALEASADDVLAADGYLLGTPANFGYMSGALKHFFDRTYYTCEGAVSGRPYALCVHGDNDTTGAVSSVERIITGWGLHAVAPAVQLTGEPGRDELDRVAEVAATVAAHLLG